MKKTSDILMQKDVLFHNPKLSYKPHQASKLLFQGVLLLLHSVQTLL